MNKNIKNEGKATRFGAENGNDNTMGGRKPSIRNEFKKLLLKDGAMKILASQVISIEKDGSVIVMLPKQEQIALKLSQMALGKNGPTTLKAILASMDQVDGKPVQPIEQTNVPKFDLSKLNNKELDAFTELLDKVER